MRIKKRFRNFKHFQKSVTVRKSVADRRTGSIAEGSSLHSSESYSYNRKESGYFSPRSRTPDSLLDSRY